MANEKLRPGPNKRRLCDMIADDPNDGSRPNKRISPFHNTPIQKKETKRRILKISLKKMKGIECPETFLRRSVLINNLARSLQDDLRDDKLWDRWGWECDLDTFPNRSPHPIIQHRPTGYDVNTSNTCTLLTNACTSSSASNQWTLGTHAHWINGDDDAHLSPSERERVTRDLAQSHDRLAQTVERLTAFGDHRPADNQTVSCTVIKENCENDKARAGCVGPNPGQLSGSLSGNGLCTCGSPLVSRFPPDGPPTHHHQQLPGKSCSNHKCSNYLIHSKAQQSVNTNLIHTGQVRTSSITHPSHLTTLIASSASTSNYGLCGTKAEFCATQSVTSKAGETWTMLQPPSSSSCAYTRQLGTTTSYDMDMTSQGFGSELSLLGNPLGLSNNTTTTLEPPHSQNIMDGVIDSNGNECNEKDSPYSTKRAFTVPPCHVTTDMTLTDLWSPDPILESPVLTSQTSVTCSAEVDRPSSYTEDHASPFATMTTQTDQDKFTSQAVRDFDVIYNNLVSVLIGGN